MKEYRSIAEAIAEHAVSTPKKTALADAKSTVSYAGLYAMIRTAAEHLIRSGLKAGDRVVLIAAQTAAYAAATFGVQLAGGVIVPLEKNSAQNRVEAVAREVDARFIVAQANGSYSIPCISLEELLSEREPALESYPIEKLEPHALSKIMFTTGTTGKSKGVMITHAIQVAVAQNVACAMRYEQDDVTIIPLPLNHGYGYRRLYSAMYAGITAVLSENVLFAKQFLALAKTSGATVLHIVPAQFKLLCSLCEKDLGRLAPQMRVLEFGAAALPESVKESAFSIFPNTDICMSYGCTEAAATSTVHFKPSIRSNCIGVPLTNSDVYVVDENGERCRATKETPGRIVNAGKTVMRGYWNEPELTAEVLKDGCLYTNDLGYYDEENRLYFLGRQGDVINIGGIKISPAEIEDVALAFAGVEECACVSGSDPVLGCIPVLFVCSKNENFSVRELFEFMLKHADPVTVPKKILKVDAIPKTSNGKIDRKELRGKCL